MTNPHRVDGVNSIAGVLPTLWVEVVTKLMRANRIVFHNSELVKGNADEIKIKEKKSKAEALAGNVSQ